MRMRVRQRRQDRHLSEIDERRVVSKRQRGAGTADRGDPAAIDGAPSIQQRALRNRQNPARTKDQH
jgi:hypothetical protein